MTIFTRFLLSSVLLAACGFAAADPVPAPERIPVDVRRTTLLVRDIERSLPVYRDALGLRVVYDQFIGAGTGIDGKPTPPTIRLVLLRANDTFVGLLGLMQRLDVEHPPQKERRRPQAGEVILVVNAADLEERFPRLRSIPGVTIDREPHRVEYPSPDGKGTIPVMAGIFFLLRLKLIDDEYDPAEVDDAPDGENVTGGDKVDLEAVGDFACVLSVEGKSGGKDVDGQREGCAEEIGKLTEGVFH